jgi:hypothetical protein
MMKRTLSFAAMAALSLTAANSAGAQSTQDVWDLYFYSDATHTQLVGYAQSRCTRDFQGSILLWGYSTQHRAEQGHRPCGPGYYDDQ